MNEIISSSYSFFIWNINSSIKTSILIIFILLIKVVFRYKISVKFQYIIWFLIIFRLLIPNSFESHLSINNFLPTIEHNSPINRINNNVILATRDMGEDKNNKVAVSINREYEVAYDYRTPILYSLPKMLLFIWITVMFLSFSSAIFQNYRFNKLIRKDAIVTEHRIINLFEECKTKMYVNKRIPLIITEKVKVPTLYGIITPRLLLPQNILKTLTSNDLRLIFLHELSHFKRKDILIYWVLTILTALHWFNPLIRYAFHKMREDCELCCDLLVLNYIGHRKSMEYGRTIIKFAENISREHQLITSTLISKNKSQLKRRITMINLYKKGSYKLSLLAIALLFIISFLSLTNAYSKPLKHTSEVKPSKVTIDNLNKKNIIIYNTHSFETYRNGDSIIEVAKSLKNKLSRLGLESTYLEMPKNINPSKAYSISHKLVVDNSKDFNKSVLIDIHRDIVPNSENDKNNLLRIVLGKKNPNFNQNSKFANSLLKELKNVNGIKADIFVAEQTYNQDLSMKSVLIEIGNNNSSKQDVDNCIISLGEALKNMILESY